MDRASAAAGGVLTTRLFPTWTASLRRLGESVAPRRWRLPLPSALDEASSAEGALELVGAPVHAPLGVGPCAAWRLQVFFDVEGDAVPVRCILDEGASAAARVGDVDLDAAAWVLDETSVRTASWELSFSQHEALLRARGYDASDGDFRAVLHVVHDGDELSVSAGEAIGLTEGEVVSSASAKVKVPAAAEQPAVVGG